MDLTEAVNDYGALPAMASKVEDVTGMSADTMLADGGYVDEETLRWTEECNSDVLMPVSQHWRESRRDDLFANRRYQARGCRSCSFYGQCVTNSLGGRRISVSVVEPQRAKRRYELRKQTVEPVFGRIKSNLGLSRFLPYGIEGATAEAALMCMARNVLKCMTGAAAMAYVTSTNARIFAADIVSRLLLAFTVAAMHISAIARRPYPKAVAVF